jgi:hypothetical protein
LRLADQPSWEEFLRILRTVEERSTSVIVDREWATRRELERLVETAAVMSSDDVDQRRRLGGAMMPRAAEFSFGV